ncbi:MAG: biotin--[acetyl-CoA-carboxylase] ligase [Proteobacteria bacterium]|jgi:BirA family biotin operon repressor/biotin-[acetyl-CoA-carboxylase] ligase|nr:biotin--[acetyl-CoA-carboxylase] ligase [Pseudomonadota bacterium]MDA1300289.1 biotin--[acetyl-CoA-carboxylase] ligase [Pseudomonadota bacterium]
MSDTQQSYLRQLIESGHVPYRDEILSDCLALGLDVVHDRDVVSLKTPVELLDPDLIRHYLSPGSDVALQVFWSIDSTNTFLMSRSGVAERETYQVCLAEQQTAGRGRRGRQWVSPFGTNLYLSVARRFRRESTSLEGLSLVVGMQIVLALRDAGVAEAGLKWPNDILLHGGKLAGILIEVGSPGRGDLYTVTGIGVNLGLSPAAASQIDQPFSTVPDLGMSRNELAGRLLCSIFEGMEQFATNGFAPFRERWPDFNLYQGLPVTVLLGDQRVHGDDAGIDQQGNLRVRSASGLQTFNAGEVSIRRGAT